MTQNIHTISNCPILIIEDDKTSRTLLRRMFEKQGFTHITEAENGRQGLEYAENLIPMLIIMDVMMPEMDGMECCRQIRANANPLLADVPILFQTALDSTDCIVKLFEVGATDYLSKPIHTQEITARAMVHLQNQVMLQELRSANARLAADMDTARSMQQIIMPNAQAIKEAGDLYRLSISGHFQPCQTLGGDFWGFRKISMDMLAVYMVDFSGHGVGAALNVFRLHALMQTLTSYACRPDEYLSRLNQMLTQQLPTGQFATMLYGVMHLAEHRFTYASAGAPPPLIYSKHAGALHVLESSGLPLGTVLGTHYELRSVAFHPGDSLFCYSDALVETPDTYGNLMTEERIGQMMAKELPKEQSMAARFGDYFHHHHQRNMQDDLTLSSFTRL